MAQVLPAQAPAVPPLPAPAIPFLMDPGEGNDIIDLTSTAGIKLYNRATAGQSDKFDGTPDKAATFQVGLEECAAEFGWYSLLSIADSQGRQHNLIYEYGQLSMAEVKIKVNTYAGQPVRAAQNSNMLARHIMNSLTPEFKSQVVLYATDYKVNGKPDGLCLLKQVYKLTFVDTKGTVSSIRYQLVHMSTKLVEVAYDVQVFNDWVRAQVDKLTARGAESSDLLNYLWEAYRSVPDKSFAAYMTRHQDLHEDDTADYNAREVMAMAENKYKTQKLSGEWCQRGNDPEIVAMSTQIKELTKKLAGASKQNKAVDNSNKASKKSSKAEKRKKSTPRKKDWKWEAPTGKEKKVDGFPAKEYNNKTYFWCQNHSENGMWVIHHPGSCKLGSGTKTSEHDDKKRVMFKGVNANLATYDTYESD